MKTSIKPILASVMTLFCFAFTNVKNHGLDVTFGFCEYDPSQIELTLKKDYTFTYQDFSISAKKVKVEGTYEIKKNTILLSSTTQEVVYHNKWRISNDKKVAKSRKGLTFYTLKMK